jgi:hypothetical protein
VDVGLGWMRDKKKDIVGYNLPEKKGDLKMNWH